MKISISYKNVEWHEPVELAAERAAAKLGKLLQHYEPDLVQLHGCMECVHGKEEFKFSLSLALPSITLHASGSARGIAPSVRLAFAEIETQLKKHTSHLRHQSQWQRKRRLPREAVA
ncbi:MAG: HPF/RaiA family ribosome-associated protein [Candidatus Acidiferrales bacterium]